MRDAEKSRFRKIDACTYEVGKTGYRVELMGNHFWDAYLPAANGPGDIWRSPRHATREAAARAIAAERRRVLGALTAEAV